MTGRLRGPRPGVIAPLIITVAVGLSASASLSRSEAPATIREQCVIVGADNIPFPGDHYRYQYCT